jgi:hypothetical protein
MKIPGRIIAMGVCAGAIAVMACTALAADSHPEKGSGTLVTQARTVGAFAAIRLDSIGSLTVERTGTDSVTVTIDDNLQATVTAEIKDGTLVLAEPGCRNCSPTKIAFKVTVSDLKEIELPSTGSAEVSKLESPSFAAKLSGTPLRSSRSAPLSS